MVEKIRIPGENYLQVSDKLHHKIVSSSFRNEWEPD